MVICGYCRSGRTYCQPISEIEGVRMCRTCHAQWIELVPLMTEEIDGVWYWGPVYHPWYSGTDWPPSNDPDPTGRRGL